MQQWACLLGLSQDGRVRVITYFKKTNAMQEDF